MGKVLKILPAQFFRTTAGNEPVREWFKELDREDRFIVGDAVCTVEYGWPVGMPVCRSLAGYKDLWEVRATITHGRIARVIFYVKNGEMILLHGFIKKTRKTPQSDLDIAVKRKKEHEKHG